MKPILYRREIQDDLNQASRWYEQRREGLGDEFIRAVEKTLEGISRNPLRYAALHRDVRCARLGKFPYGIFFYVLREEVVVVLAVIHHSRDPSLWKERR